MEISGQALPWTWQKIVSGLLAICGVIASVFLAVAGQLDTWMRVVAVIGAVYGCYFFGRYALQGTRVDGA